MLDIFKSFLADTATRASQMVSEVKDRMTGDDELDEIDESLLSDRAVMSLLCKLPELPTYSSYDLLVWASTLQAAVLYVTGTEVEVDDGEDWSTQLDEAWERPQQTTWFPMQVQNLVVGMMSVPDFGCLGQPERAKFRVPPFVDGYPQKIRVMIQPDPVLADAILLKCGEVGSKASEVSPAVSVSGFTSSGVYPDLLPQSVILLSGQEVDLRGPVLVQNQHGEFLSTIALVGFVPDEVLATVPEEHRRVTVAVSVCVSVLDNSLEATLSAEEEARCGRGVDVRMLRDAEAMASMRFRQRNPSLRPARPSVQERMTTGPRSADMAQWAGSLQGVGELEAAMADADRVLAEDDGDDVAAQDLAPQGIEGERASAQAAAQE
jgi:hypothetical protein